MKFAIATLALVLVIVAIIVVNAPPPDDSVTAARRMIPIETVFTILEAENDAVRKLWTERIVGAGKEAGLQFDERWRNPDLDAGPLPALFLRETAESLRRSPEPLYLFLGSQFPINDANKFTGIQYRYFENIQNTGEPQFFFDDDIAFHTAMFSDVAVAEACVTCHNAEPESPKTDWKLGDVMGATTWSYPQSQVSLDEALAIINALRQAFHDAYQEYADKVSTFSNPPPLGQKWPDQGYFLPSTEVFTREAMLIASPDTLHALLAFQQNQE